MADSRSSLVDPYGFERPVDFDAKGHEEFMSRYLGILTRRARRWRTLMKGKNHVTKSPKLQRFVRKGIPLEYRPMVWMDVSGAMEKMREKPQLYFQLLQEQGDSDIIDLIRTDISRTFPNNINFRDISRNPQTRRGSLFNVLLALSLHHRQIGYCQGMNFLTGMLLLICKDECHVFWLMNALINNILPGYFSANMIGLKIDCEVLHQLVRLKFPDVHRVVEHCGGGSVWSIIATRWFICLFIDVVPTETVLRIWDCLFYEGNTIIFQVGLTLIKHHADAIVKCQNLPEMLDVFRGISIGDIVTDCHAFMENIFNKVSSLKQSSIVQLRREVQSSYEFA